MQDIRKKVEIISVDESMTHILVKNRKRFILSVLIFLFSLVFLLWRQQVNSPCDIESFSIPSEKGNIKAHVETIKADEEFVTISGWAFITHLNTKDSCIFILLNSGKNSYLFDTQKKERPDVTRYFKTKDNYDYSGFDLKISTNIISADDYQIGIYIKKGDDKESFKYTNKIVSLKDDAVEQCPCELTNKHINKNVHLNQKKLKENQFKLV